MLADKAVDSAQSLVVRFHNYEVHLGSGELRKRGLRINIRDQSFQVLAALLQHPGQLVTREELRRRLWGDQIFVDFDNNLNAVVAHLREVLSDTVEHPRYIETLPRRGYRFIAPISKTTPSNALSRGRVIVLPFVNLSGDPNQDYFSDAITDEIITALASVAPEQLAVIARTTAMRYKGSQKDVARIGRELDVDYVVEGAVRRTGDRVAINVQLIQTNDQAHLFAKKYEAELRGIFSMQSMVAHDLAAHVDLPGVAEEAEGRLHSARSRRYPTQNLSAYNEYIQGRYLADRLLPDAMAAARQHFERAIQRDSNFALAHIAMADLYTWLGYKGIMRPKDAYAIGVNHALRAVEIDDTLAEAHAVLASYHKQLDYDWMAADREMKKALQLNRTSSFVKFCDSLVVLMPHNRMDEAVAALEGALELDPLSVNIRCWLGIMLLLARDYDRGIEEARIMSELEPNSCWPPFITGIAYRQKYFEEKQRGNIRPDFAEQAIANHRKAVELAPGAEHVVGWLGFALGVCEKKDEARTILEHLHRSDRYILPTSFAHVYLGLGDIDATFEWLDRAVEERDQNMMPILSYAHYEALRGDPRFAKLLRKMKLDSAAGTSLQALIA